MPVVAARSFLLAALLAAIPASAWEIDWGGGTQAGYNLGQNGQGWPEWDNPLANRNRGGFYIRQLRVSGDFAFDSAFSAVLIADLMAPDIREAYFQARFGAYAVKAGKFRGAGLRSGTGTDMFEMTTVRHPFYAYVWEGNKKLMDFRDFGLQVERGFLGGRLNNRLWFHNANGQNVLNHEPSFVAGDPTQALGLDYALDYRLSQFTTFGGHVGALADRGWDEFLGPAEGWRVDYWFKTNPIVDYSVFHQMDFPRLHLLNEAVLIQNRRIRLHEDSTAMKTWGASTLWRFDAWTRWSPFFRYEITDLSDGLTRDDAYHLLTLGTIFRPSPARYPSLKVTGEYVRALEEGGENLMGNDILYLQLQMVL